MPIEFTGDDDLTGFALQVSNVLKSNEVGDIGAYTLVRPQDGTLSGFSFGAIQWDIANHRPFSGSGLTRADQIFSDILTNARDSSGNLIFSDDEERRGNQRGQAWYIA